MIWSLVCDAFIGDPHPNLVLVGVSDEEGEGEGSSGERACVVGQERERVEKDCVSHLIQGLHL